MIRNSCISPFSTYTAGDLTPPKPVLPSDEQSKRPSPLIGKPQVITNSEVNPLHCPYQRWHQQSAWTRTGP